MKIPLCVPNLTGNEALYLQRCIETTFVSSVGHYVNAFEQAITDESGTAGAVVVSSGTVAIKLALEMTGVGRGDLVIAPSLTFIASVNAISHTGARPWLMDCTKNSWTLDLDIVRAELEKNTVPAEKGRTHKVTGERVIAIVPVMIMGAILDFAALKELSEEFDLEIIVDAAAAIGGRVGEDQKLGDVGALAVCYSFNGNKTITCGGGGAIVSNDEAFLAKAKHYSTTGRVGANYEHDVIGYNYRMVNTQAAVGLAQIERLNEFLIRKSEIADRYNEIADRFENLERFPDSKNGKDTYWFSGFWYRGDNENLPNQFRAFMQEKGIDLRQFWKPIHLQLPYQDVLKSEMSVCDDLWQRIFTLPCSTDLTSEELDYVTDCSTEFWQANDS